MTTKKDKTDLPQLAIDMNNIDWRSLPADMVEEIKRKAMEKVAKELTHEQLEMNQFTGQVQALNAANVWLEKGVIEIVAKIHKEKLYTRLSGQTVERNGEVCKLDTWEGWCMGALGWSRKTVENKLANLDDVGKEAFVRIEEIGIPVRLQRVGQGLNDSDKEEYKAMLANPETPPKEIIGYLENKQAELKEANDKLTAEKADLEAKLKSQQEDAEANEKIIAKKNETIDKLEKAIVKRENMTLDEKVKELYQELSLFEVEGLSTLVKAEPVFADALKTGDKGLRHEVTSALVNLRNRIDDLMLDIGLDYADLMPFDADEYSVEDSEG